MPAKKLTTLQEKCQMKANRDRFLDTSLLKNGSLHRGFISTSQLMAEYEVCMPEGYLGIYANFCLPDITMQYDRRIHISAC